MGIQELLVLTSLASVGDWCHLPLHHSLHQAVHPFSLPPDLQHQQHIQVYHLFRGGDNDSLLHSYDLRRDRGGRPMQG